MRSTNVVIFFYRFHSKYKYADFNVHVALSKYTYVRIRAYYEIKISSLQDNLPPELFAIASK